MKLMKLGARPDTFFTSGPVRSVYTEVATDLDVLVDHCLFRLHKFPLLSKCQLLQTLCAESDAVELAGFPGGAEAFEACAKFCYGIAITVGAHNLVPLRCAAARLGMTEAADNLAGKLDAFMASCLLRRWRDALAVLRSTARHAASCDELGVTSRCVEAVAILATAAGTTNASSAAGCSTSSSSPWWARDVSELGVDLFFRVMVAIKAAGTVKGRAIGDTLKVYARRWLPRNVGYLVDVEQTGRSSSSSSGIAGEEVVVAAASHRILVEKMVSLLPSERNAVSCSFLLKLLKAGNVLRASPATKTELTRRAARQLEDASVSDLLIPSPCETLYDVDAVMAILEELALRQAAAAAEASPAHARRGGHRRSRSAESSEFEGAARRSTSAAAASHGEMVRIGRLVDGFLMEVAKDPNLPLDKLTAIAEAVPDCARPVHDDLYRAVDTYLRVRPEMDKGSRKKLCRVLNCRKLSETASMHAAQNELLPLRVVVQVLFFENARAAAVSGHLPGASNRVAGVAGGVKALLAKAAATTSREANGGEEAINKGEQRLRGLAAGELGDGDDGWSVEGLKRAASRVSTLRMKLEEDDDEDDVDAGAFVHRARPGLVRSASSRVRKLCAIPAGKPKRMLSRLWPSSRSAAESDRH
nr:unnamed protein product [Digitaria exilis]